MAFVAASTFERAAPGLFRGAIDPHWLQGRGAYGGLLAAILVRAIEAEAPAEQRLVTLGVSFCAPATAGPAEARVQPVRVGRNVSTLRASLVRPRDAEGEVLATALATLARPREVGLAHLAWPAPQVAAPEALPDGPEEHYIPEFTRFFEFRQALGPRPFSGGSEARVGGWCRLREPGVAVDRALACALLDAWPPAAVGVSPGWCPVASLDLTCDFLAHEPQPPGEWLLYEARARRLADGLADETATLWSRGGRPIATARQCIAILAPPRR